MKVMRSGQTGLALLGLCAMAACGSSSSSNSGGVAGAQSGVSAFQEQATRIDALPGSAFTAVPDSGSATFTGLGSVGVSDDTGTVLSGTGDVSVTVDFGTSAVTGGLTNITGTEGGATDAAPIAGELALSNGDLFEARPNAFGVTYTGTLGAADYDVEGRALGVFRGTRSDTSPLFPLRSVAITDDDGVATSGTDTFTVDVQLYGETE